MIDNKNVIIRVYENQQCILKIGYLQLSNKNFYHAVEVKPGCVYEVTLEEYNSDLECINLKKIVIRDIRDIDQNGRFILHNKSVTTSKNINIHHINPNGVDVNYVNELSTWGVTYRSYLSQSELGVIHQFNNYDSDINVVVKDVNLCVTSDRFVQYVRQIYANMISNKIKVLSLNPLNNNSSIAYLINNNFIDEFKKIDSILTFHSYITAGSPHYNFKSL